MIRELRLRNFKCFRELNLPLAPLTLLAGLNGMGKSTVVQAILLLYQSIESGDLTSGRLLLAGDYVDLGSGVDVLYEDAEEDIIEFGLQGDHIIDFVQQGDHKPLPLKYEYQYRFVYDREGDRLQGANGSNDNPTLFVGKYSYLSAERLGPRKTLPVRVASS